MDYLLFGSVALVEQSSDNDVPEDDVEGNAEPFVPRLQLGFGLGTSGQV
jgi:hypothetical protein